MKTEMNVPDCPLNNLYGYERVSNFWEDFSTAEGFGKKKVRLLFQSAFSGNKDKYQYLRELLLVLRYKMDQYYMNSKNGLGVLYGDLYGIAESYAKEHWKEEEKAGFIKLLAAKLLSDVARFS